MHCLIAKYLSTGKWLNKSGSRGHHRPQPPHRLACGSALGGFEMENLIPPLGYRRRYVALMFLSIFFIG